MASPVDVLMRALTRFSLVWRLTLIAAFVAGAIVGVFALFGASKGEEFKRHSPGGTYEFSLPAHWRCQRESDGTYTCQLEDASKAERKTCIIIVAEKQRGPQDTMDNYLAYLQNAKPWTDPEGTSRKSDVVSAKRVDIRGHEWVDSTHFQSEIAGFHTRYLATTTSDTAILVTYSAAPGLFEEHRRDLDTLARTLRVYESLDESTE